MKISLIAAIARNNTIGKDNTLLWHVPEDLKLFNQTTMGHFVLMGRKTFESLKEILSGRKVIVISKNKEFQPDFDCSVFYNISDGINEAKKNEETELFICGGGAIYEQTIGIADAMYITELDKDFFGDTSFPFIDKTIWQGNVINIFQKNEQVPFSVKIVEYKKLKPMT
jgi:dihydrofolate reductase